MLHPGSLLARGIGLQWLLCGGSIPSQPIKFSYLQHICPSSDKPPSNARRGKRRREAPPFPPSCMSTMPVTASPPPTPPSSLPLCPRKQSAQTELLPLRVIFALNRWGLAEFRTRIVGGRRTRNVAWFQKSKIGAPRIIIFHKSKTIVAPTIAE